MFLYAHLFWLAIASDVGCGPDGDEIYRLLLFVAPLTAVFSLMLLATAKLPDIHRILRWLAIPLAALSPLSWQSIWRAFGRANRDGLDLCSDLPAPIWQQWWAPVQLLVAVIVLIMLVVVWRSTGKRESETRPQ